jgi:hypothetical protein
MDVLMEYGMIIAPIILIELVMKVVAIRDILRNKDDVRWDARLWIAIVIIMTLGWGVYYLVGKSNA